MMNQGSDDLPSQLYPDAYTQFVPQQGKVKRRRRSKKVKSEGAWRKRNLSAEQVNLLELSFGSERKLDSERKERIAGDLGLDPRQVAVWFQNRRARWRTNKLHEEFSKLNSLHADALLHKCRLESQVLELKEQLAEAERQIQRLSVAGHSPRSSQSVVVSSIQEKQFYGNGNGFGFDDVFYGAVRDYVYGCDLWI